MSRTRGSLRVLRNGTLGPALLVALLGVVSPCAQARERQRPSIEALETMTHELVNEHRRSERLPPLDYSRLVASVARRHSEAMAESRIAFGHEGFETRRRRIARSIPLEGMAENVGVNTAAARRTARMTVAGWLGSAGHRENIEGDYDATGIGIARGPRGAWYFTQIFVKRRGAHERLSPPSGARISRPRFALYWLLEPPETRRLSTPPTDPAFRDRETNDRRERRTLRWKRSSC